MERAANSQQKILKIRRHQRFFKITLCTISLSITSYIILTSYWINSKSVPRDEVLTSQSNHQLQTSLDMKKYILLYHTRLGEDIPFGKDVYDFSNCKSSNCRLSTDTSDLKTSNVVIFHHNNMPPSPPKKQDAQFWIFTTKESPMYTDRTYRLPQWRNEFNFVMDYRHDSDFFYGYGDIIKKKQATPKKFDEIYDAKERDVAWIVSHCNTHSKRESYVQEMRKYIDVDILGGCGNKTACINIGQADDPCRDMVGKRYKFYLSFENNLCRGYTTEKLFFVFAYDKNIIPIVRGAFNSKDYLPKDAIIFSEDFKNPKELALFLKELGSNKNRYINFLREKDKYTSKTFFDIVKESFCEICKKLENVGHIKPKPINVEDWLYNQTCREPKDIY